MILKFETRKGDRMKGKPLYVRAEHITHFGDRPDTDGAWIRVMGDPDSHYVKDSADDVSRKIQSALLDESFERDRATKE